MVERLVEGEELLEPEPGRPLPVEVLAQLGQHRRVELGGHVVQRGELDRLPEELRRPHPVRVHARDERADLREDLHQALLDQQDQALPHGCAADPERRRQLVLRQRGAGRELQRQDLAAQRLVDDAAVRPRTGRGGHTGKGSAQH